MRLTERFGPLVLACLLIGPTACEDRRDPTEPSATPPSTASPPGPVEAVPEPAAPRAVETVSPDDARQIFDRWLKSQNDGDFVAYSSTYAEKFEGIKRVGPKTFKFDHDGWLKDRERMFKKKMSVSATDVNVATSSRSAVVSFVQTWESGTFKDVGPKVLVISRVGDQLAISREEMLTSKVGSARADVLPYDPNSAALLDRGGSYIVLDIDPKAEGVGRAKSGSYGQSAYKVLAEVELAPYAGWQSRSAVVYDGAGTPCTVKTTSVVLLARIVAHFGDEQYWRDNQVAEEAVAQQVWEMGESDAVVAVGVDATGCSSAIWASTPESGTKPLAQVVVEAPVVEQARRAMIALPGYRTIQKDHGGTAPWHEAAGGDMRVRRFGDFVSASVRAGAGCGEFFGEFWALWKVTDSGWTLLSDPQEPGAFFEAQAAFETGDGKVGFSGGDLQVVPAGTVWRPAHHAVVRNLDCPC